MTRIFITHSMKIMIIITKNNTRDLTRGIPIHTYRDLR